MHGNNTNKIPVKKDFRTRINLTFRYILKFVVNTFHNDRSKDQIFKENIFDQIIADFKSEFSIKVKSFTKPKK